MYRRYASLFFIAGSSSEDNELITLEIIHRYVEQMDKYYGNVCELDIIFSFTKAYYILDELLLAGELQESSKKNVLRCIGQQDSLEDMEVCSFCCYFFLCRFILSYMSLISGSAQSCFRSSVLYMILYSFALPVRAQLLAHSPRRTVSADPILVLKSFRSKKK